MRAFFGFLALCWAIGCSSENAAPTDGGAMDATNGFDATRSDVVYSPDGAVCKPKDLTGFQPPMYTPPIPQQNACTAQQIQDFYDKCVGDQSTVQGCQLWSANNKACNACLGTAESDLAWGALVYATDGYRPNTTGCIATLGFSDCAKREDALWACTTAACHDNCPPDADGGTSDFDACRTAASTSVCKAFQSEVSTSCPMDSSSIALCLQTDLQKFYMAFAPILCSSGG
jgi:hypothetical protein